MKYGAMVGGIMLSLLGGCAENVDVRHGPQAIHPSTSQPNQILANAVSAKSQSKPASDSHPVKAVRAVASTQRKVSRRGGSKRTTVRIGDYKVTWNDFTNVYNRGSGDSGLQNDEGVYMFSRTIRSQYTLPNGARVDSSECYSKFLRTTDEALRSAYLKCHNDSVAQSRSGQQGVPLEEFVSLARQAVQAEGGCVWLGYDRTFDQSARSVGAIASAGDERLFFAKLRCAR